MKQAGRRQKPGWVKDIAKKRIRKLLSLAKQEIHQHPERSHRYVELARKLSSRYNVTIPQELKRFICRKCSTYLVPGVNLVVRTSPSKKTVVYTCKACGAQRRYGYSKRRSK
jgi:ribonuclease P protein subunit RPR2